MAGAGGVSCDFVRPRGYADKSARVEIWQVPGVDSYGAQNLGQGDSFFRFTLIRIDTSANIESWRVNIEALKGAVISIVDDFNVTHSNCLVTRVSPLSKQYVYHAGVSKARAEITIEGVVI